MNGMHPIQEITARLKEFALNSLNCGAFVPDVIFILLVVNLGMVLGPQIGPNP